MTFLFPGSFPNPGWEALNCVSKRKGLFLWSSLSQLLCLYGSCTCLSQIGAHNGFLNWNNSVKASHPYDVFIMGEMSLTAGLSLQLLNPYGFHCYNFYDDSSLTQDSRGCFAAVSNCLRNSRLYSQACKLRGHCAHILFPNKRATYDARHLVTFGRNISESQLHASCEWQNEKYVAFLKIHFYW